VRVGGERKIMKVRIVFLAYVMTMVLLLGGCALSTQPEPDVQPEKETQEAAQQESGNPEESVAEEDTPEENAGMVQGSAQGTFTTTDLYGNEMSQEIFAEADLTVVNVWATYCGPCIQEMPYLGELAKEYDSTQVQFIGVPTDVYNQEYLEYALSLVEETGADYTHLLLSEELYNWGMSDIQYVPTTFFVNREGEIMDTVVGSLSKEEWKALIDNKLASL